LFRGVKRFTDPRLSRLRFAREQVGKSFLRDLRAKNLDKTLPFEPWIEAHCGFTNRLTPNYRQ
jgi:hypothetical protein